MVDMVKSVLKGKLTYLLAFLVGFPACGALFGYLFFLVLNFATGPYSGMALKLSVLIWFVAGVIAGTYGYWHFRRYAKVLEEHESRGR